MQGHKKYYTIAQAVDWVVFRGANLTIEQRIAHKDDIEKAIILLQTAFAEHGEAFDIFGKTRPNGKYKQITFYPNSILDMDRNYIMPCYDADFVEGAIIYGEILICATQIQEAFPAPAPVVQLDQHDAVKINQPPQKRPGVVHDIAFYLFENNPNLSAKELAAAVCKALTQYPQWENAKKAPVETLTMGKWLTEFKKKTYKPIRTKEEILRKFPGVFAKLHAALK